MKRSTALRQRLNKKGILVVPGAQAPLIARVIERGGFEAVYATGAGIANLQLGLPDIGLATMTEVLETVTRIVDVTSLPVIADIDNGYGNPLNTYRSVLEFSKAGVAAIQIEDQSYPKRCGHFEGKSLISGQEMVAKIHAARDGSLDSDLVIIGRTDAIAVEGFASALERARIYGEAGADLIFVEAPTSLEQLSAVPKSVGFPVVANMVEGGKTPLVSATQLEAMGYSVVLFANATLKAAIRGIQRLLEGLTTYGSTGVLADEMIETEVRNELTFLRQFELLESKYDVPR